MKQRDKAYEWWKRKPRAFRKPAVFMFGLSLIICAPLVGWLPGPGGVIIFLAGIATLASEFDWAESLQVFFLKKVPAELNKRWQPTPKWQVLFDFTGGVLLLAAGIAGYTQHWAPLLSLGIGGFCLLLFNRGRLDRLKLWLKRRK